MLSPERQSARMSKITNDGLTRSCTGCFNWRRIHCDFVCVRVSVPSAPRALQLTQTQDEPPVIAVTWQPPRSSHGRLEGYKLTYGIRADSYVEERRFDAEKLRFTTGFLSQLYFNVSIFKPDKII